MTVRPAVARRPRPAAAPRAAPRAVQLVLFPEAVDVRRLDARAVAGARTRVRGVWQVRYERERAAHRVFADRHGWYCEEHGPTCRAAADARAAAERRTADRTADRTAGRRPRR
jgi:hypothetical protein